MIKIIEIRYMIGGLYGNNKPCKNIEQQVQHIFDENKKLEYIDLIYKPIEEQNMRFATLIVKKNTAL